MSHDPILIVEDNEDDVFIMQRAFQKAKIVNPLVLAKDGQQAIDYLKSRAEGSEPGNLPVLVLLDLKMPVVDGFEVLEWIRRHRPLNRLVVLILSSSKHVLDVARAYELHANSFLVKRSSVDEMVELIRNLHNYWFCWNERPDYTVSLERL